MNNLTNCAFYSTMQEYHRERISEIEKSYGKTRNKREKRLKERIEALQKQVLALEA